MNNGVYLLVLAMCLTPGGDILTKQLTADYSPFTVAFFRYMSGGLIALSAARLLGQKIYVPKEARAGQFFRALLLVASMLCLITAFSMVPLAYAVGGFLIAPIIAVVLCTVLFKERLDGMRIVGVVISLLGAILISKPAAGFEFGTVFALAGGVLLGTYLAFTRNSADNGGVLSTLTVQCFIGAGVVAPIAFLNGIPSVSWPVLLTIVGLGFFSAGAHVLTVAAYERADAAVLSPFMYFNLIAAVIAGYFWFNEVPTLVSVVGLVAIAGGGILSMLPQFLKAQSLVHAPNLPKIRAKKQRFGEMLMPR